MSMLGARGRRGLARQRLALRDGAPGREQNLAVATVAIGMGQRFGHSIKRVGGLDGGVQVPILAYPVNAHDRYM